MDSEVIVLNVDKELLRFENDADIEGRLGIANNLDSSEHVLENCGLMQNTILTWVMT